MTEAASILAGGGTYGDVATAANVAYDTARMRCRRAGLRSKHAHRPPDPRTARRVAVARAMAAQGYDNAAIGERLGMDPAAVRMMRLRAERSGA